MPGCPGFPHEKPADTMPIKTQRPSACWTYKKKIGIKFKWVKSYFWELPLKDLRNRLYKNLYHLHDTLRKPFLAKFLPTMKRRDRLREYKVHLCVKQNPTWMPASLCHRSHLSLVITGTLTTCNTLGRLTSGTKILISGPVTSSGISAPQPAT